jgi:four helix bundle protein
MDGAKVRSFRDLLIWQKGMELSTNCYRLTKTFPKEETYGLISQIRRASVSVPANISEGFGRDSTGDFIRFLRIAQGSLKEVETLLELSVRVECCPDADIRLSQNACTEIGKMIRSMIRKLKPRESGSDSQIVR